MNQVSNDLKVWVYRKGNGGAYVFPTCPQVVQSNGYLTFVNLTECRLYVIFPRAGIVEAELVDGKPMLDIATGGLKRVLVTAGRGYYEYKARVDCGECGSYEAEGGSDPGVIVD